MPARQFCVAAGVYTPPCDRVQISDLMRSSYRLDFLIDLDSSRSNVLILFLKLLTVHKLNII